MSSKLKIPRAPRRATEAELWEIHRLLAQHLLREVSGDKRPSAAVMAVARKFLVDNTIAVNGIHKVNLKGGLEALAGMTLPFAVKKGKVSGH